MIGELLRQTFYLPFDFGGAFVDAQEEFAVVFEAFNAAFVGGELKLRDCKGGKGSGDGDDEGQPEANGQFDAGVFGEGCGIAHLEVVLRR